MQISRDSTEASLSTQNQKSHQESIFHKKTNPWDTFFRPKISKAECCKAISILKGKKTHVLGTHILHTWHNPNNPAFHSIISEGPQLRTTCSHAPQTPLPSSQGVLSDAASVNPTNPPSNWPIWITWVNLFWEQSFITFLGAKKPPTIPNRGLLWILGLDDCRKSLTGDTVIHHNFWMGHGTLKNTSFHKHSSNHHIHRNMRLSRVLQVFFSLCMPF